MANMSYCRFQNTKSDLDDCVRALESEGLPDGGDERAAAKRMRELCAEFIESYDAAAEDAEDTE